MRFLVSNDDGYFAAGLHALSTALRAVGEVVVVAPDQERSGASNSLTLTRPLRMQQVADNAYKVDGTPTDCVHLALTGLLDTDPDFVISGINAGANLGDDTLYSGTVAAAMEGRSLGRPAIAVSLVLQGQGHYETAAAVVVDLLTKINSLKLPASTIININVPDLPYSELRGIQVTRLGRRHRAEPVIKDTDPRGWPIYWVGMPGTGQDAGPGTDFYAVEQGYVSITPLHIDLTSYAAIDALKILEEKE